MNNQPPINNSTGVTKESLAMKEKTLGQIARDGFCGEEVGAEFAAKDRWQAAAQAVAEHVQRIHALIDAAHEKSMDELRKENIKLKADYESLTYDNIALTAKLRECTESFTMLENSNLLLHEEIKKLKQQHPVTKFKVGDEVFTLKNNQLTKSTIQALHIEKEYTGIIVVDIDGMFAEDACMTAQEAADWVVKGGVK